MICGSIHVDLYGLWCDLWHCVTSSSVVALWLARHAFPVLRDCWLKENDYFRLSYVVTKNAGVAVTSTDVLRRDPFEICAAIPASVPSICFWFSPARPSKYQFITFNWPRPHSSKSFTIHHPPYSYNRRYSVQYTVKDECSAINHKRYFVTSFVMLVQAVSSQTCKWVVSHSSWLWNLVTRSLRGFS